MGTGTSFCPVQRSAIAQGINTVTVELRITCAAAAANAATEEFCVLRFAFSFGATRQPSLTGPN